MSCKCDERGQDGHPATLWVNARVAHLLAMHRMVLAEVEDDGKDGYDTSREGFVMHTQKVETLGPFSSHVKPIKMMEAYLGERLNVMMQSLHAQDGTLPPGLMVQNMYTELRKGSKKAVVVVKIKLPTHRPFRRKFQWQE